MTQYLQVAWTVPKSEDFDLREFALGVLEIAPENLLRDGNLIPTAFAITANHIHCYSVSFANLDEKPIIYSDLIEAGKSAGATALITCNDALRSNNAGPDDVEGYYPGKLAVDGAKECIMLTVSGPAIQTWSADIQYQRMDDGIEFGDVVEQIGGEVGFLVGWASEQHKVQ